MLTLALDRGFEADLAVALDAILADGRLPGLQPPRTRFTPEMPDASAYDPLLSNLVREIAA